MNKRDHDILSMQVSLRTLLTVMALALALPALVGIVAAAPSLKRYIQMSSM